jgi:Zn-dependent peptidase ImmA (M78 family)/transcriptional regulator with XRE-family HTH domain
MAIRSEILTWARETAGLSLEDAAHAIGLKTAYGQSGAERLAGMEAGQAEPPRNLLVKMSEAYRRPLLVFYLSAPPKIGDRGQDFRTLPGPERHNPELDALIRDINGRHELIKSMLEDAESEPLNFVGSAKRDMPVPILAKRIADHLQFQLLEFRATKTPDEAFGYLRARIEGAGVFVLLLGNLGSHHTNIPVEIFRGFAISDPIAPLIVINDQDARAAWSFTALHELAHLWLGDTGISGIDAGAKVEQYCNDVAGEVLVPAAELAAFPKGLSVQKAIPVISDFAEQHRVSRAMVSYKLLRAGMISRPMWSELSAYFQKEWLAYKQRQASKLRAAEGGPSYYVVRRHRVGQALLGLVRRSLDEGNITYTKASRVLGVKPRNVEPLLYSGAMRG